MPTFQTTLVGSGTRVGIEVPGAIVAELDAGNDHR